jgi:hypothetical protein
VFGCLVHNVVHSIIAGGQEYMLIQLKAGKIFQLREGH